MGLDIKIVQCKWCGGLISCIPTKSAEPTHCYYCEKPIWGYRVVDADDVAQMYEKHEKHYEIIQLKCPDCGSKVAAVRDPSTFVNCYRCNHVWSKYKRISQGVKKQIEKIIQC